MTAGSEITVKELHAIINERERSINLRFEAQENAVAAALAASEKAVAKAELAAEKRFDAVNEFRGQLKDQAATFATRNEIDIRFKGLEDKIAAAERARTDAARWLWGTFIAVAGLIIAFVALRPGAH